MFYRIARWKTESHDIQSFKHGLGSPSRRQMFTKRPAKVNIPVLVLDLNEVAFRHFTEIHSIDWKKKNKFGYHLKNQKRNTILAWLNVSANDSMEISETAEDMELCTSSPSNSFRPMTEMMDLEYDPIIITEDCDSIMTEPPRKALMEKVNSIDLIVAMFSGLSLDDKRKIKESDREHFETFQSHRPYARPYGKRIKMSNN